MTQTPNGNRWLLLEKSGRLLFHDPHIAGELVDWDMGPGPVCDIAVDRKSERVAVASADGQITVLETQPSDRVPSVITKDESKRWLSTSLFEDDTAKALTSPRAAVIGQDYRAAALVLRERDSRKELVYVAETPGGTIEEIIQADGLSDVRTIGLTLDSFNCPVAVYRCQGNETTEGKTYLADLRIARRSATRNWNKQTITKNQNVGHFPIPIVRDGQISDIFHFDYGTMSWKRTYADGDIWRQKMVGRFGDGFGAFGISDRHGNAHFIFRPNRVGSDGGPNFYARWNGAELQREVVDPAAEELLGVATTDASVYVLLRRPGLAGTKKHFIAKRNVNGQWTYEKLPFPHLLDVSLAIGRAGRIFVVGWSADACQLALFVKNQNQWTRSVLEEFPGTTDQQLRWAIVQVDSPTRPVIMVGGFANDTARRWIRVYRLAD